MKEFQKQRIMVIKEILPNIKNCVLKGGTSLLLYYNLDRFSEDIDLDSISSNPNISSDIEKIIKDATEIGYSSMLLDTLPFLKSAIRLYKKYGFYEISSYNNSPMKTSIYMKLDL